MVVKTIVVRKSIGYCSRAGSSPAPSTKNFFVKILAYVRIFLYISTMNKITREYEDEDTISIWTYDTDKFKNGPISVEIIEKKPQPVKRKKNI